MNSPTSTEAYTYQDFISSIEDFDERYADEINEETYFGFPIQPILDIENSLRKEIQVL